MECTNRTSEIDRMLLENDDGMDYSSESEGTDILDDLDEAQQYAESDTDDDIPDENPNIADDPDDVVYNPQWVPYTAGLRNIPFSKENKILVPLPEDNTPFGFWELLLDDEFLQVIVEKTNEYAWQIFLSPTLQPKSRINKWTDLTLAELKIFIGLIFHMGTVRINDYWKTDKMFNFLYVREQMPRDRFLLILRCLHLSDNHQPTDDRLAKMRILIDYFNKKISDVYYPGCELSLDEGTVLWRGRLLFRQYISGKRHKYGIKVYSLCEPDGLCLAFTVYSGKGGELSGKGHASKVVKHLMQGKLGVGHTLYMDNYYNSFPLATELLAKDTYCTGTLLSNRKYLPAEVVQAKLRPGEKIERYAEGVMVGKWRDKRNVMYISTKYENDWAESNNRYGQPRQKPLPIVFYNAYMKGVDRNDQMMSYYPFEHKSLRWYKKMFVHFLQMLMVNSFKLYRIANPRNKTDLYSFRLSVINKMLTKNVVTPPPRPRQSQTIRHVLSKSDLRDKKGDRFLRKRCRQCAKEKKKNDDSIYLCSVSRESRTMCLGLF